MYIDLSDLDPVDSKIENARMSLCLSCRRIIHLHHTKCPSCTGSTGLIPYLDMRPLLLSRDIRSSILGLIDEGVSKLTDEILTDGQGYLSDAYLPFLTRVLQESETAEKLSTIGNHTAYRKTDDTKDEIIASLRDMLLPPTSH